MNKLHKLIVIITCITLLVNMILLLIAHFVPKRIKENLAVGKPFYFVDPTQYWCGIEDFLVCGEKLYVFYASKSILCCYDLNGEYQHSYAFSMPQKGKANLYSKSGVLYLESTEHSFYLFKDGIFVDYLEPNVSGLAEFRSSLHDATEENPATVNSNYKLRGASIWRTDSGFEKEILHRAGWLSIFQGNGNFQIAIHFLCLCVLIVIVLLKRKIR